MLHEKKKTEYKAFSLNLVGEGGFEPPKSVTTDLQSVPFGRSGTLPHYGAGGRTRTPDLLITNQLLYQLSYTSVFHVLCEERLYNIPQPFCSVKSFLKKILN